MRSAVRNSLVADHMLSKTLAHTSGPFVVNIKKFQPASSQQSWPIAPSGPWSKVRTYRSAEELTVGRHLRPVGIPLAGEL